MFQIPLNSLFAKQSFFNFPSILCLPGNYFSNFLQFLFQEHPVCLGCLWVLGLADVLVSTGCQVPGGQVERKNPQLPRFKPFKIYPKLPTWSQVRHDAFWTTIGMVCATVLEVAYCWGVANGKIQAASSLAESPITHLV